MGNFINFVKGKFPSVYNALSKLTPGTQAFNNAWRSLASGSALQQAERDFVKQTHYTPALNRIKSSTGVDVSKRSPAVQEALFSTAIQHGQGGANNVWRNAGINNNMSDRQIINAVYNERSKVNIYFKSSSQAIKNSVANRFQRERQDILNMLS